MAIHEFERHGWQVEVGHIGNPMRFNEQHRLIGQGLRWQTTPYVPFSAVATIPALFLPSIRQESRGRNDSARTSQAEKLSKSEEDLLEHRTDGSDVFDTLYISCEKFPVHDIVNVPVSGVM